MVFKEIIIKKVVEAVGVCERTVRNVLKEQEGARTRHFIRNDWQGAQSP
jgi:hypothetical protein